MKMRYLLQVFLAGIILLCLIDNCSGPPPSRYIKDGKQYGKVQGSFRHRWWNFYERALSFMEGEFYKEALSDLDYAVKQRYGDKRMARTYGMHFVDYFPHREKGLIYYLQGDHEAAKKELEISSEQEPTAKTQFYLDKIRKILIEREKPAVSIPNLLIDLPSDEIWTRDDPVVLAGTAQDEQYILKITLAGRPYFLESARQRVEFSKKLKLGQGEHRVKIVAENLLGGQASRELRIHVDRQGPVISLEPHGTGEAPQNLIQGFLYDESGEISLSVDGVPVSVPKGEDVHFSAPIKPKAEKVLLLARDKLGNETRAEVDIDSISARKRYPMLAALGFGSTMSDAGGLRMAFSFGKDDKRKPVVRLRGWTDDQTVFLEKAYIEGEVRDESNITELRVNDVPILRRKSRIIFFNHLVDLNEGENIIRIEATDKYGNAAEKIISISRQVPNVFETGSRFSISLFPFGNKGLATGLADMYYGLFFVRLMDQNRFRIIEREQLDRILQEQKLSHSGLISKKTAIKTGRLLASQATLIGDFVETRIGIEAVARLIDNETSEILAVKDVYGENKDRAALMALAEGLAIKFHREFPLVDGVIARIRGSSVFTSIGKGETKPQRRLIIYREGEPVRHPTTGRLLGRDTEIIGFARVTQVLEGMSKAVLLNGLDGDDIKIEDKVLTE